MNGRSAWSEAWKQKGFRVAMWAGLIAGVGTAIALPLFFGRLEQTPGARPFDPVIGQTQPVDVSWITFTILYGTLMLALSMVASQPWSIVRGLHAYVLIMLLRMVSMMVFTFEPPLDIIPLIDPVTAAFYPAETPFLKDLFFSGHTATLALMVCISIRSWVRWFCVVATAGVGALVIAQHVHWTIDVLAAPLFVWLAWKASAFTLRLCAAKGA